jgi:hypothetical protein
MAMTRHGGVFAAPDIDVVTTHVLDEVTRFRKSRRVVGQVDGFERR